MRFARHAFISYSHIDNQPLPTEKGGWVSLFHEALEQLLAGRLGGNARIWRDDKLRGNDVFSEEIVAQFPDTAALVSVLSPRYLNSEWCSKELARFCDAAERTGGVVVDNKCRVFKVLKLPVDARAELPSVLAQVLGYEFYELDTDHTPRELDPAYGEKPKQDFLRKVAKLAWDIKLLLDRLEAQAAPATTAEHPAGADRPVVYLAECSRDRRDARELLDGELTRLGYTVLPEAPLPTDEGEYVAEVDRLLARCRFSVHLVGSAYGMVPDGPSQKSVAVLQNERAVQHSREGGLRRVIWLPDGTRSDQPAQAAFIESLHMQAEAQLGADLITGDIETLRTAVHAGLKKLERPEPALPVEAAPGRARLHVLCDARDRKDALPLLRLLRAHGEVSLPIFAGDAAQVREANQALLTSCNGVLLYYGAGDEAWKFHQQNELKRIRALRTVRPLPPEILYLAAPSTDDKDVLVGLGEPNLIDARAGLPEAAVTAALATIAPGPART